MARPGLMSPGEEHEGEFGEDVGVGDVEVVFQGWDGDVAVDLWFEGKRSAPRIQLRDLAFCLGGSPTLWSTYSCPAITALFPIWNPIRAVWSFMKPPKLGAKLPPPLPPCTGWALYIPP